MLHYTDHARDRMAERGITEEEVEYCLSHYDARYPCEDDEEKWNYVCTTPDKRRIRVVVDEKKPAHKRIISAMD